MEIDFGDGDMQVDIIIFHWKDLQGLTHLKVPCLVCKCVRSFFHGCIERGGDIIGANILLEIEHVE
jgi:hypothetical protein